MTERELLDHIVVNRDVYSGKPILRGKRIAVTHVLGMLIGGATQQQIVDHYEGALDLDDIRACLLYAQKVVENEYVEPLVEAK
jgi:uncharacterized protein (DUF433 family)